MPEVLFDFYVPSAPAAAVVCCVSTCQLHANSFVLVWPENSKMKQLPLTISFNLNLSSQAPRVEVPGPRSQTAAFLTAHVIANILFIYFSRNFCPG